MKKLLLSSAVLAAIFMSCGKDDNPSPATKPDDIDSTNTFAVDNKLFKTPYAWMDNNNTDPGELNFTNVDLSVTKDTTVLHGLIIEVDTLIDGQTYTFLDDHAAGFDRTKHFSDAEYVYDAKLVDEIAEGGTGNVYTDVQSGSLTVHKQGEDNYSFTYTLTFVDNKKVVGNYTGKVRITNN
ncbi:hypothetical protein F0L74_08285 [Chitinophaga agrisoli]|uniref:Lipid-binding hydrolase n=1 Tax=Chitinophaga agrisoli TaxID=2607653 RepID=A0A5B2VWF6_9BACT|nr:hypothetical protein [Chitinophaga agrisoli]KAA2242526.1 hypothetical protein F0L74_08285 [Chitinophaga agrisoli]